MKLMLPFQKQPKIFAAFKAGFDTVSKHLYLLFFLIILDLFLLFGFRITIVELMQDVIQKLILPPSATPDLVASWGTVKIQTVEFFRYFSLTSFLRTFPVGIPSLFSVTDFERNPIGTYQFIQLQQPGSAFLVILGMSLIGLFFAFFFYRSIARAISTQSVPTESILDKKSMISWIMIPTVFFTFTLVVIFPAVLIISLIGAILPIFTSIGYFLLTIGIITLITPMLFTPHFIFLENMTFKQALLTSFRTVRLTNAKGTTFLFIAIVVSYLTNMLWRIPSDDSWMLLVSVFGHALISTVILVASFHFILDARKSVREFIENQMSDTTLA